MKKTTKTETSTRSHTSGDFSYKTCFIGDLNVETKGDAAYLTGYANNKGIEDAYGDIPTNFNDQPVYNLSRYQKNPVLLVDHNNSSSHIAGSMVSISEDDKGLKFKAKFMNNPINPLVAHTIQAFKEGHGRALSIGGHWHHQDEDNPKHLTKADIHEISLVGVGADGEALTDTPRPKQFSKDSKGIDRKELEELVAAYRKQPTRKFLKNIWDFHTKLKEN